MQEQAGNGSGPKVLPGPSSVRLIVRGNLVMLVAGCLVLPLAFESSFKSIEDIYAGVILVLIGIGLAIGYRMNLLGSRKRKLEIERGYTPKVSIAVDNPGLYLVDYKTFAVISRPHEPRPETK